MANDLTANPWTFDSVMATPYIGRVYIKAISWSNAAVADQRCQIKDVNGRIIADMTAQQVGTTVNAPAVGWVNGLQVTRIDSGQLIIAIDK